MKVLCIADKIVGLTKGKWYKVKREEKYGYWIIDDDGYEYCLLKKCFKTQSQIREEKLGELGI